MVLIQGDYVPSWYTILISCLTYLPKSRYTLFLTLVLPSWNLHHCLWYYCLWYYCLCSVFLNRVILSTLKVVTICSWLFLLCNYCLISSVGTFLCLCAFVQSDLYITLCLTYTQTLGKRLSVSTLKTNVELTFCSEPHAGVSQTMSKRN